MIKIPVKPPPIKRKDVIKYLIGSLIFLAISLFMAWMAFTMPYVAGFFFVLPIVVGIYAIFNVLMFFINPEKFYMMWLGKESKKEYVKLAVEKRVQEKLKEKIETE